MYGKNILGRFRHFGRSVTFDPFSNTGDLKLLNDQWFYIPNQTTFAGTEAICVCSGLASNSNSFLSSDFFAEIIDLDGTTITYLNPKLGIIGSSIYPSEIDIVWFDIEGGQGDYWINEKWRGKILKLSGKFECSTITAEEMNQLTGCMMCFGGNIENIPNRALPCHGQTISRFYYANLFDIIGTNFGEGDGVNTFNLPDFRDATAKGVNNIADKDENAFSTSILNDPDKIKRINRTNNVVGGVLGSYQRWAIQNISGTIGGITVSIGAPYASGAFSASSIANKQIKVESLTSNVLTNTFDSSRVVNTGLSTRDNNLYVHYIIFI